ncbi:alpha/beta superfamily hydrolase [Paenibacillus sp. DS2015]|uniref:hypothetical protein n=1 Tax=Paenibacillus sp. DS2015 TaxID=3373917 RepID=UPI003D2104F1
MPKVYAPNKQYIGLSAGVSFVNGIGESDDPNVIEWFRDHGYEIEEKNVVKATGEAKATEAAKKEAEKQIKALRKKAMELGIEDATEKDAEMLTADIDAVEQK